MPSPRCATPRACPATALAWGQWDQKSSLAGEQSAELLANEEAMARFSNQIRLRLGFARMSPEQGLELFDAARGLTEPFIAPVNFDTAALRSRAQGGALAPIMRGLIDVSARLQAEQGSLGVLLAETPEAEREALVLDLVRSNAAAVLGHSSPADVEPDRAFQEMGLDSLGAIELRNRLSAVTGLAIAPTLVFDYPSSAALAERLLAEVANEGGATASESKEDEIRQALAAIPLARLRRAGLIDPLLRLAESDDEAEAEIEADDIDLIDSMDVEDLIRKSSEGLPAESEGEDAP